MVAGSSGCRVRAPQSVSVPWTSTEQTAWEKSERTRREWWMREHARESERGRGRCIEIELPTANSTARLPLDRHAGRGAKDRRRGSSQRGRLGTEEFDGTASRYRSLLRCTGPLTSPSPSLSFSASSSPSPSPSTSSSPFPSPRPSPLAVPLPSSPAAPSSSFGFLPLSLFPPSPSPSPSVPALLPQIPPFSLRSRSRPLTRPPSRRCRVFGRYLVVVEAVEADSRLVSVPLVRLRTGRSHLRARS